MNSIRLILCLLLAPGAVGCERQNIKSQRPGPAQQPGPPNAAVGPQQPTPSLPAEPAIPPPCGNDCVERVLVTGGTFYMGSDTVPGESRPRHQVTLSKDFWLDKYEVAQKNYAGCLQAGACPQPEGSFDPASDRAVYGISW